ncbi:MAG: lytic transglycosylase domain-containing protein [Candidatus Competibacteraceae bacterium]|jgi:soluble lytic murein transglycosylase-like protein|nr:lytic transglycosylase domain-containing protein [Candidatus Competibacteraceae bacterium]
MTLAHSVVFYGTLSGVFLGLLAPLASAAEQDWVTKLIAHEQSRYERQYGRQMSNVPQQEATRAAASRAGQIRRDRSLSRSVPTIAGQDYLPIIRQYAQEHRLPTQLIRAIIQAESSGKRRAVSPKGAQGLMQLMPATAKRFGVTDPFDPAQNIEAGTRYMAWLLDKFDNNLKLALAGYNAGENAVVRYGNTIPPYPETRQYVKRVLQFYGVEP